MIRVLKRVYKAMFGDGDEAFNASMEANRKLDVETRCMRAEVQKLVQENPDPISALARNMQNVRKRSNRNAY